jgi:hypothetical protein
MLKKIQKRLGLFLLSKYRHTKILLQGNPARELEKK